MNGECSDLACLRDINTLDWDFVHSHTPPFIVVMGTMKIRSTPRTEQAWVAILNGDGSLKEDRYGDKREATALYEAWRQSLGDT